MSLRVIRTAACLASVTCVLALCAPACVVRLSDRNSPIPNGGVTGPNADCNSVVPESIGGPGTGKAATKFVGRYDFTDPTQPHFDWSGNYMTARFNGTDVTWGLNAGVEMVLEEIIDGQETKVILGGESPRTISHTLEAGDHEITVMRTSEALFGDTRFMPFTFGPGTTQLPATEHPRHIEYIGDSITCGYGDEGNNATCPYDVPIRQAVDTTTGMLEDVKIPRTQNIYLAYGSIAARQLSADAVTICYSGKGVVLNYREQGVGEGAILNPNDKPDPDAKTTIPQYYLRTLANPTDPVVPPWDFSTEVQPQVVVLNIGTNDFARDVDQNSVADGIDLDAFRAGYLAFVQFVRSKRPAAQIFLALPPMVTDVFPLPNARTDFRNTLNSIVEQLNGAGDPKVYFIELVEMGVRYGLGCDYHPNLEVHRIMADQVAGAIHLKTCW
jgi:lysophospholipase L1-like esterase